jgi:hypothetical protein
MDEAAQRLADAGAQGDQQEGRADQGRKGAQRVRDDVAREREPEPMMA